MNNFGEFLYALRKERGFTQAELADKLNVTNKAVSKWETGEAFPETAQLIPLSKVFGVTVDELLNGCRAEAAETAPAEYETPEERAQRYQPAHFQRLFAAAVAAGLALVFLGVIAVIVFPLFLGEGTLAGVFAILACVAAAVSLFAYAGILHDKLYLPVETPGWKRRVKQFAASISCGLLLLFTGAELTVAMACFAEGSAGSVALLVTGILAIAGAVCVFAVSGIRWEHYYSAAAPKEYRLDKRAERSHAAPGAVCGFIMLLALTAFLLAGLLGGYWHPGWVAFPAGALLCGVVNILFGSGREK